MSEEAIISEAQSASYESAPHFCKISSKVAREALPDIGLVIIKGKISLGTCKALHIGERAADKKSLAPDAVNRLTLITKAQSDGKSLHALIAPSLAPLRKAEK